MTEQQRNFNPDRAAMDAVSRIQDVFGTGYLDRFDAQRFAKIQGIIGDVIRAALSHAEGEAVTFTCHGNSAPAYSCNKPGDMSGTYYPAPQKADTPVEITGDMVMAFHNALTDGAIPEDDFNNIKTGLKAAFANITHPAPQVAVPEGYALVPMEQTEEMLDAWFTAPRGDSGSVQDFSTAYAALLAAAPTAPAGGPERDLLRRYRQAVEKTHRARRATPAAPSTDLNRALVEQERVEAEIDALLVDTGEEEWVGSKRRADLARQLREYSQRKETKPVIDPDGLRAAASALLEKLPTDEIGLAAFHAGDEVRALISALGTPAPDEREIAAKALDEMADTIAAMSDESDNSAASRALYRAAARCNARAGRLRAGKEGE